MSRTTTDIKSIRFLRDLPETIPVSREGLENWTVHVTKRGPSTCKNYISPNRRDFYKIMYISKGTGIFTLGLKTYCIKEPTILFLHPNEIISWRRTSQEAEGYICFFRKKLADDHPGMKAAMEKYQLFSDSNKSVIRLTENDVTELDKFFGQMYRTDIINGGVLAEDAMQAYLQLIMTVSVQAARYPTPDNATEEFKHIHEFFQLLEKEAAQANYATPVQVKTAKEFADKLLLHPNHLNALLKKHTGQNVSTHIKNRLLEESKVLLLQTDWTLQDIGFAIGFADQPNFSQFFKKNMGITPATFRRNHSHL
ncbi:AraC family transcriptional regulator [Chitinophagaceae bacterium MMS25-I14]